MPIRKMDFTCSGKCKYLTCNFFVTLADIICSSSDGRLCLIKSENGKVKVKIDGISPSKAPFGALVSMDDIDRLFAIGNDDGDIMVIFNQSFSILSNNMISSSIWKNLKIP